MAGIRADVSLNVNTSNVKRSLDKATNEINKVVGKISGKPVSFNVNAKSFTQPLGRITASANEFSKSLEASNARVIAFGASVGIINGVSDAFRNLVLETIRFEKVLSDINVVLGLSNESIQRFGEGIFDVAMNTAQSFNVAADAALEFSRQGLSTEEVLKRTNDALILTRLTSLNAADAVAGLTAAVNAFGDAGLTTTDIIDKLAAVDVKFAVSSEDLINGLQRAGAVAIDAGVELDSLVGLVAALQQTTARGGAVIGNSLKTIFTRIQRPESIRQIEDLGVAVRNIQGEVLSADRILLNMAKSFNTLTQAQQSNVVQFSAGIFQANVFRSILRDLAKEQSLHAQATEVSANASGEAAKKNEILNKTLAALASQAGTGIRELAGIIGELALKPEIGGFLEVLVDQIEGVKKMLGGGEDEGNAFAKGLVRGIGNVITGPAAIAFGAVFIKMFLNIAKFASTSLKDVLGIVSQKDRIRQMEESIVQALSANKNLQESLNNLEGDRLAQEKFILGIIEAQTSAMREQQLLASRLAKPLIRQGVNPDLTVKASGGLIPQSTKNREREGARKGGYAPGSIDSMNIPGLGPVVYNKAETVKQFPGMKQPAIMPPKQSRAGSAYKNTFKEKHGFDPYASHGFVPNFAMKRGSTLVMDKAKLKVFGTDVDIGRAVNKKYQEIQEHFQSKLPINIEAGLQQIITSSTKDKKQPTGKESLFESFSALSGAGIKSIERPFDVRSIGAAKSRGSKPKGLSPSEFSEKKVMGLLKREQSVDKVDKKEGYRLTYDPQTNKGLPDYPVDIISYGENYPTYEVKSGSFNPANLIFKSLRMASDRELPNWMQQNKISGGKKLQERKLKKAETLSKRLDLYDPKQKKSAKEEGFEFSQDFADQWGLSQGFVPNFKKDWRQLYSNTLTGYNQGKIKSREDLMGYLGVSLIGLSNLISPSSNPNNKAIRAQLSEVQLDELREINASVSDKGRKDWKSLYSTTISARNQGKINSREELAKSLGVSANGLSTLISLSSYPNNKAIREQLSEVQLDELREINASVFDKGKDWKSLYSTTISARNQGKINSREELAKSLGVSASGLSTLVSLSSYPNNKAIREQLSEVQLDKLRQINNSLLSDKSGTLSQTRLKGDLFEKAISILSGQPFKKGKDALDFSRAQARPVLMDSKIREQIDLGQDVRYGDAESGSGHKLHLMRDKVIRELEEGGQLYSLIQRNGDINLPGKTFTDIVANGSDAKPKESSSTTLGKILKSGRTTAGTKNAIEKSLTKKYKGKITPAQRQKEYQRNVNFDYYVDDVNLENLKVDKRTKLGKELGDIDKQFLALSAQTQSDGLVPNFASLRSPIKFDVGDEKSYGKSYVARTVKSGKLFLLEQGHKHFSEYMESQGKPTPKMTRGVIGGREGYWVNQHEDDILEWSKKPNIEYIRKEKEVKEQREQESKDYMQKLKYGSFEPLEAGYPLQLGGGELVRYSPESGFGKTIVDKMGPEYKHISVNAKKIQDYARDNNITKKFNFGPAPDYSKALNTMLRLPKADIEKLDFIRPREKSENEKKTELRDSSPKSPIKWDVKQDMVTKKKSYAIKASDDTFSYFKKFLKTKGVPQRSIQNIDKALQGKSERLEEIKRAAIEKSQSRSGNQMFYDAAVQSDNFLKSFSIPTKDLYIKDLSNLIKEFNSTVYTSFSDGYVPDYGAVEMNKGYVPNFIGFNVPKKSHQLIETFNQITEKNKLIPTVDSLMEQGVDRETAIQQTKDDQFGQKKSMFKILNKMKSEGVKQLFFGQGGKIFPHQSAGTIPFTIDKIKDVINGTGYKTNLKSDGFVPNYANLVFDKDKIQSGLGGKVLKDIISSEKRKDLFIGPSGVGKSTLAARYGEFIKGVEDVQEATSYTILSGAGKTKSGGMSPALQDIIESVNKSGGRVSYLSASDQVIEERRQKRIDAPIKGDLRSQAQLKGTRFAPKNQSGFTDIIKKASERFEIINASEGLVPNFAVTLSNDQYYSQKNVQHGISQLYKKSGGRQKLAPKDLEFAAERYISAVQDSGKTYPGGNFNVGGKKFNFNELSMALMKHGQFYQPKEGEAVDMSEGFAEGLIPNYATKIRNGAIYHSKANNKAVRVKRADQTERIAYIKHHTQDHMFDPEVPFSDLTPASKKQVQEYLGRKSKGKAEGFVPNFAVKAINSIIDGDTVEADVYMGTQKIDHRLSGVDAVEKDQAFGTRATTLASKRYSDDKKGRKLLEKTRVSDGSAAYNRGLFKDRELAKELVLKGYGIPDLGYLNKGEYAEYSNYVSKAKKERRGIWGPSHFTEDKKTGEVNYNHPKAKMFLHQSGMAQKAQRWSDLGVRSTRFKEANKATYGYASGKGSKGKKQHSDGLIPNFALTGKEYAKFSVTLAEFIKNNTITPPIKSLSSREIFKIPRRNAELAEQTIQNIRQFISSEEFSTLEDDTARKVKKDYNKLAPRNLSNPFRPFGQYSQKEFSGGIDKGRPTLRRAVSKGFVPNFASPLKEAIKREKAAGVPVSTIRVEKSPQLKSSKNPMGLAVTNTRDEPLGVGQGIRRARSMGIDPKKHGASKGLVPNFAKPNFPDPRAAAIKPEDISKTKAALRNFSRELNKSTKSSEKRSEADNRASDATDDFSGGGLMKLFVFQSLLSTANGFLQEFAESGGETAKTFAELGQAASNVTSTFLTTKEIGNQILEVAKIKPSQSVGLGGLIRGGEARRGATKEIAGGLKAAIDFKGVKNAAGAISSFGKGLSVAGKGLLRFTPIVGQLITFGTLINEGLKIFTGKGIFDLLKSDAAKAADKLKELAEAADKTENALNGANKLQSTQEKITELKILGDSRSLKQEKELWSLKSQEIKNRNELKKSISEVDTSYIQNESLIQKINQVKTGEITKTEDVIKVLTEYSFAQQGQMGIQASSERFFKSIEGVKRTQKEKIVTPKMLGPVQVGETVETTGRNIISEEFKNKINESAVDIAQSILMLSSKQQEFAKKSLKDGKVGEIRGLEGFNELSEKAREFISRKILEFTNKKGAEGKENDEEAKAEAGARDELIKRLFLIKQGRQQEALRLKLRNKGNELYRNQNAFLHGILSEYGGISAAAKIEADAARKTAKIRSDYNEKLLDANQKLIQGTEGILEAVIGEGGASASRIFGKAGKPEPVQFTEETGKDLGLNKEQVKVANKILQESSEQASAASQSRKFFEELNKAKDKELYIAMAKLFFDQENLQISQKEKNKLQELINTRDKAQTILKQDNEIALENLEQQRKKKHIDEKTVQGAQYRLEIEGKLNKAVQNKIAAEIKNAEGSIQNLKRDNAIQSSLLRNDEVIAAYKNEAVELQKKKNINDILSVTKSNAQVEAQIKLLSNNEEAIKLSQERLRGEILESELTARQAQLKNEFYSIESNRLALVKSQLQSEIDNLNTDNLIKQSRLELLTQYGKINELVAAQIQQSRLQATTDLATSIETAEQRGTPESMLDVAEKMSALTRETDTGSRAMDALRERLAEAQVNAANLGADLVNIGFDEAKSGLKQLFKDIGSGAKSASEAWESFGLNIADSLLDRIMEQNIDKMMSNLSVAFTGQDIMADATQRLNDATRTLDTSTNTLNTTTNTLDVTTGSLNSTMGTLNTSVQGLTTAIGSINLNPGQPSIDVTVPSAPAQGPSASAPVQKFLGGKIQAFNKGGFVKGEPGIDRVPAMLTAGEYVLNKEQVNEVQKQGPSTTVSKPDQFFMESPKQISKNIAPKKAFEGNITGKLKLFKGGVVQMFQDGGSVNKKIDKGVFDVEKRIIDKKQVQEIQNKEILKVKQNPAQELSLNTAKISNMISPEKALEGSKELGDIKKFYGGKIQKFQEGGVAERVKAGAKGAAQFAVMTGVSSVLSKKLNKKQDNPPPKFDMRKLDTLDLGSDVNIKRGDPRLSARFIAEDPVMQEYRDHLLELATYRAQKTNEKFRERQGTLASVMGAVMSFAVGQLVSAAAGPIEKSIQKGKNFMGKTMGQHKDQYSKALTIPGGKDLNYSQISQSIKTGNPIKVGGRDWTYSGDSWVTNPTRPAAVARQGGGSIPAMLTAGEGFVPAPIARRIGYGNLNKMNQTGSLPIINGPAGIDKVGPVGLNEGDFIIKKSSTDKLLRENPNMMKFALQNPEGFKKGERGYYEGGVVGTATRAAPSAPKTYKTQSAPEQRNRISSLIEEVDQTRAQESAQSTSNSVTNNINVNVSIDKSGNESVSTEQTGSSLEQEKDLSMKIKAKVLEVIRDEKRIGGELS
jgi:TP901 family phage tail tape measure protein